jgi:hypothetical protein
MLLAAGTLLMAGCIEIGDPVACTADFRYGILVEVRDAGTDLPLAGARGAVHDGAYVDSLRSWGNSSAFAAAGERAGVYLVEVQKSGYQPWTANNVVVTRDECHVRQVQVVARLQPL